MRIIHFDQLHSTAGAFIDLGSALEMFRESPEFVTGDGIFGELRQAVHNCPPTERRRFLISAWPQILRLAQRHEAALGMLEQAVVHDSLFIDQVLIDKQISSLGLPLNQVSLDTDSHILSYEFFALTDVPESVRADAAESIYKNRLMFTELNYKPGIHFTGLTRRFTTLCTAPPMHTQDIALQDLKMARSGHGSIYSLALPKKSPNCCRFFWSASLQSRINASHQRGRDTALKLR